jgi:MHS family alpha-ketoglutarate permease-like MFS transporter
VDDRVRTAPQEDELDLADMRRRLKAIFIGSMGNLVEWYDFYAYAAFSLYFAAAFFPGNDPVVQQLNAAVLFAAGFLVRPIGGWLFGHLADHFGRRMALMTSVAIMCFGSLMIAVTPTYASIGIMAPVILSIARIVQGLSLGGEYGTSATYLSEVADPRRRGFFELPIRDLDWGAAQRTSRASAAAKRVPDRRRDQGLGLAHSIRDRRAARRSRRDHAPGIAGDGRVRSCQESRLDARSSLKALLQYPREVLLVVGLTLGGTAAFYTYTTYMQTFLKLSVGLDEDTTTLVAAGSLIFAMILQPLYGYVSDHIGRRPVLTWFGVCGVIFTYPLLSGIQGTKSAFGAFCLICFAWIIVAGYTSINAIVKAELFPTKIRATGVGLPYALTVSIFDGSAPAVALAFKNAGHETWFYFYLTAAIFISLIIYVTMRDTKKDSAMERHV